MANRNERATQRFMSKAQPVILGKVSEVSQDGAFNRLVKAAADQVLAKLCGGSSVAGAVEHNLAVGASTISLDGNRPLSESVSPIPGGFRAGSDRPSSVSHNRNVAVGKSESHSIRGILGNHTRFHKSQRNPTCPHCNPADKISNQPRELQAGQE